MEKQNKTLVYDLPTRIFHWLFALLFLIAIIIGLTVDDDSTLFSIHKLAGLIIAFILVFRLVWGVVGTTYARFTSFRLNPIELVRYLKNSFKNKAKRYFGHNPASSYAAVVMFLCTVGLVATGIVMTVGGESEFNEETHELFAYGFLIAAIAHVAGLMFHQIRHMDSIWMSMIDGTKKFFPQKSGIANSKQIIGILFLLLTLGWTGYLYSNYNKATQTLNLFGQDLVLGEAEHESESSAEEEENDDE